MKIRSQPLTVAAFTLVEIALSLAIIGFALVAIIGVLPFGLNVQRENREETIIVQDANYLLDAIRTGARGLNDLTNYVDTITNYRSVYNIDGANTNLVFQDTFAYTFNQAWINGTVAPANVITNGERIVGLLSTPRILPFYTNDAVQVIPGGFESNYVVAYIRALSGPAVEKAPQANPIVRDLAFRYRLIPEVTPFDNWNLNWVNQYVPGLTDEEKNTRSNAWRIARQQQVNTHEVRLLFRWPIDSQGRAGNQRQVFRTLVSGNLAEIPTATNEMTHVTWLMQPSIFLAVPNQ